ncbi:Uncharacterized protein TCM_004189 [Theobroma cacao]|uniref:Uncharacterized protein n=1 Tax=Theobroma cacao TaxID=3641 RepID=A0A061DPB9_THECC|nr:Uncharacterized protein TCM_004189 [Theobroma cacao]
MQTCCPSHIIDDQLSIADVDHQSQLQQSSKGEREKEKEGANKEEEENRKIKAKYSSGQMHWDLRTEERRALKVRHD